jgi:2-keto-3-deoxy-L-rhamnonate aldolase RhmA
MNGAELAQALHSGRRVYGTCVVSPSPSWPPMIAGVGLDFVFIDTEHVAIGRETLSWMCRTYSAHGLALIVRIPKPDPYQACTALDGGAAGVIAPYLESVDQVRDLRGAVKLRPLKGQRLQQALRDAGALEHEVHSYLAARNAGRLMIINIESVPALEALDDMLGVPGIDAVLVGPHDLSINLGIPEQYSDPLFSEAISTIIRKTRAANVGVGIHYSSGIAKEIAWAQEGANLIVHSSDVALVHDALRRDLARFHSALDDARPHDAAASAPETI